MCHQCGFAGTQEARQQREWQRLPRLFVTYIEMVHALVVVDGPSVHVYRRRGKVACRRKETVTRATGALLGLFGLGLFESVFVT